jgi:tetrapyrrole methylase family protein/MazG family protein/ATP diphosphatase
MKSSPKSTNAGQALENLVDIIATLRSENGCPWDRKQTPDSFHPYILEEYHELVEAIGRNEQEEIRDELGDLLFLVVFVAYMFEQERTTTIVDVIEAVSGKMTRRHPHVFGGESAATSEQVITNWHRIKESEAGAERRKSALDGVPRSLPALSRAQKLAGRAARTGFDWIAPADVLAKVREEFRELEDAIERGSEDAIAEELGDLLFVLANVGRHLSVDSEGALNRASDKFERRFKFVEVALRARGVSRDQVSWQEMLALWHEAKQLEK